MFKSFRVNLVKGLIDLNEKWFFERRLNNYYKKSFQGSINTIVDVGVNKGQTIEFFLQINPNCTIYGFEPNGSLYQKLVGKYKNNPKIKIYNKGISDQSGEKLFHENIFDYTSTFEALNMDSKYLKRKSAVLGVNPEDIIKDSYMVNITTLSDFINSDVSETIDILKIDTEGHEYTCLQGLFSQPIIHKVRYIQLESHNDDMYANKIPFEDIIRILKENNFVIDSRIKHGFGDFDEVIFKNETL